MIITGERSLANFLPQKDKVNMKFPFPPFTLPFLFLFFVFTNLHAKEEATLEIKSDKTTKTYTLTELLSRSDLETITVKNDPSYPGHSRTYKAIRFVNLIDQTQIAEDQVIQFKALDGFSAPLTKERLLNTLLDKSIAYIAVESPTEKWPPLKPNQPSAGPFYLIWANPELSQIGPEEWPYMLSGFEVKGTLKSLYPKILPKNNLPVNHTVNLGFKVFIKNCFACHAINQSGSSQVGPDLNYPMNPTEYFKENFLRKYIRNPQSVRHWPQSRMNAFNKESLSDNDLNHLINYLKHMAMCKKIKPQTST